MTMILQTPTTPVSFALSLFSTAVELILTTLTPPPPSHNHHKHPRQGPCTPHHNTRCLLRQLVNHLISLLATPSTSLCYRKNSQFSRKLTHINLKCILSCKNKTSCSYNIYFIIRKALGEKRHTIGTGTRCSDRNKGAVPPGAYMITTSWFCPNCVMMYLFLYKIPITYNDSFTD